jgi:hypothetical protein
VRSPTRLVTSTSNNKVCLSLCLALRRKVASAGDNLPADSNPAIGNQSTAPGAAGDTNSVASCLTNPHVVVPPHRWPSQTLTMMGIFCPPTISLTFRSMTGQAIHCHGSTVASTTSAFVGPRPQESILCRSISWMMCNYGSTAWS